MAQKLAPLAVLFWVFLVTGCQKPDVDPQTPPVLNPPGTPPSLLKLSYTDSIFYLKPTGTNIITPAPMNKPGEFFGFPDGIQIDPLTGAIDLEASETGLRYKIMFVPTGSTDTVSTKIVISGINFYDKIYRLSDGDTIARPIYNANGQSYSPGLFGTGLNNSFDDDRGCNNQGCNVSLTNGSINLAQSIRNGAIRSVNDDQKEFTYYYKLDDPSQKTLNKLKVKLYYYNTAADIPQYLWDIILIEHAGTILRSSTVAQRAARPRPPCVIIIAN
jgi:hypothetical protein